MPYREDRLLEACRVLFGHTSPVSRDFLLTLKPEGVRQAYRKRAWEYHPDASCGEIDRSRRTELFRRAVEAYELLNSYLKGHRNHGPARQLNPDWFLRPDPKPAKSPDERYYDGHMPTGELRIGLFLYYRGAVSFQALVRSLLWQRNQRPPLGELACKWGWLTEETIPEILKATHVVGRFGERAVKLGFFTEKQLSVLVFHQRSLQKPLGRYFVGQGVLTEGMLQRFLRECAFHNRKIQAARRAAEASQESHSSPP